MASNSHVDHLDEIRDFRRALSWTLTQKNNDLEKELTRVEQILKSYEGSPLLRTTTPASPSCEEKDDNKKADIDPRTRRRIEMVLRFTTATLKATYKEELERLEYRLELIRSFWRNTREDMDYVQRFFLLRSTLQFAVMKKRISDLTCDDSIIRPYTVFIPTPNEIAEFLVYYWWYAPELTRWFLSNLSSKYSTLAVLHAVCDNTYNYQIEDERVLAQSRVADMILRLGNVQIDFSKDLSEYMVALNNSVLQCLTSDISIAKKIGKKSFFNSTFPLDEDLINDLKFGSTEFSTHPEGEDYYHKALTDALNDAEEQGYISQNERNVILGEIGPRTSSETEPYIEPNDEDKLECLPGLKPALCNMAKIRKIAVITADAECIEEKDIPLFIFRLSGNSRPNNLDPISWKPKYSDAPRHKASPVIRHPYELYYLLHYMYEGSSVMYADKVFSFFNFDAETQKKAESTLRQTKNGGIQQFVKMVKNDFQERLHNDVDASVFPLFE